MITVLLLVVTVVWCAVTFSLFVGADGLAARLRGGPPTFDWFDRTRWGGHSTPGKRATVSVMTFLATVAIIVFGLALVLLLLASALDAVLPDSPRPPARPR